MCWVNTLQHAEEDMTKESGLLMETMELPKRHQCCLSLDTDIAGRHFPTLLCVVAHEAGLSEPDACLACSCDFHVFLCAVSILSVLIILVTRFL